MIDPATGWFEIHEYDDKRSITVANIAEQEQFCRYPWPTQVTFDRGTEFMAEFARMVKNDYSIKTNPITTRNPQANSIIERVYNCTMPSQRPDEESAECKIVIILRLKKNDFYSDR